MYNSLLGRPSVFEGALKKIKQMSIQSHPGVADDVDEEKMLHALQADGSESWKKESCVKINQKYFLSRSVIGGTERIYNEIIILLTPAPIMDPFPAWKPH